MAFPLFVTFLDPLEASNPIVLLSSLDSLPSKQIEMLLEPFPPSPSPPEALRINHLLFSCIGTPRDLSLCLGLALRFFCFLNVWISFRIPLPFVSPEPLRLSFSTVYEAQLVRSYTLFSHRNTGRSEPLSPYSSLGLFTGQ